MVQIKSIAEWVWKIPRKEVCKQGLATFWTKKERAPIRTLFTYSDHSLRRMPQRNLWQNEIEFVIMYGQEYQSAGVIHHFLRNKDILEHSRMGGKFDRLVGTMVLTDPTTGEVKTAYRNKAALKAAKRKKKYDRSSWNKSK